MKRLRIVGAMVIMAIALAPLFGEEKEKETDKDFKSGLEVGKSIGTYSTTKCGGIEDGVKEGASLCYT